MEESGKWHFRGSFVQRRGLVCYYIAWDTLSGHKVYEDVLWSTMFEGTFTTSSIKSTENAVTTILSSHPMTVFCSFFSSQASLPQLKINFWSGVLLVFSSPCLLACSLNTCCLYGWMSVVQLCLSYGFEDPGNCYWKRIVVYFRARNPSPFFMTI